PSRSGAPSAVSSPTPSRRRHCGSRRRCSCPTRRSMMRSPSRGCVAMTLRLLEVDDLDPVRLRRILDDAIAWKADPDAIPPVLAGRAVAALFQKPSARTRISIEMAIATLGGHPIYVRDEEVNLDVRETVEDVARTMASM